MHPSAGDGNARRPETLINKHVYSETDIAFSLYNFLAVAECENLVARAEKNSFESATINDGLSDVTNPLVRNNSRIILDDPSLADQLWDNLEPFLNSCVDDWIPYGLNNRFRFYKYERFQAFNWHRDLPYRPNHHTMSKLTFMIYLNDDYEGGHTDFETFKVWPQKGMAVIFNHKLNHSGTAVTRGIKYVLRTDVMYVHRNKLSESTPKT